LPLADDDVRILFPRRFEDAHRDRIGDDDEKRPAGMRAPGDLGDVLDEDGMSSGVKEISSESSVSSSRRPEGTVSTPALSARLARMETRSALPQRSP